MRSNLRKELLTRQMTRKEFLQYAGVSVFVLLGLGNIIYLLNNQHKTDLLSKPATDSTNGFGTRKFGT